jgi:hypothetical protein
MAGYCDKGNWEGGNSYVALHAYPSNIFTNSRALAPGWGPSLCVCAGAYRCAGVCTHMV